jgi:hypothetical protein
MTHEGRAAVIDFQLASVHRKQSKFLRILAREDLRHLLKQKRAYAPHLLTPSEERMLAQKALPARVWMATGKRFYNFVTRRLMNWSDGEGTEDRIERDGPALEAALRANPEVNDLALCTYALPAKGVGLYVFVETDHSIAELEKLLPDPAPELVQPVPKLPRADNGAPRMDALQLIATNRLDELEQLCASEPGLSRVLKPIIAQRLNLTDRILRK